MCKYKIFDKYKYLTPGSGVQGGEPVGVCGGEGDARGGHDRLPHLGVLVPGWQSEQGNKGQAIVALKVHLIALRSAQPWLQFTFTLESH